MRPCSTGWEEHKRVRQPYGPRERCGSIRARPPSVRRPYDLAKARQLLRDAGHPRGFDAGEYFCDASASYLGEAVINSLGAVGIRRRLRPIERAAFYQVAEKKYRNLIQGGSSRFGNAATRMEQLLVGGASTRTE